MATTLHVQGGEIELDEPFNKVRRRLTEAHRNRVDYENGTISGNKTEGDTKQEFRPYHLLSFATAEGGRFACNPDKVIGVYSDEAKDEASGVEDE